MQQMGTDDEGMHQPVAFIGIGSSIEQDMQQLIIEDKVSISFSPVIGGD